MEENKFVFKSQGNFYSIDVGEILFFRTIKNHVVEVVTSDKTYQIYGTLAHINAVTPEYFFVSHRSCIVNLKKVYSVDTHKNIILFSEKPKEFCKVSRSNKKHLIKQLQLGYNLK
ncbi:LytTr DNA-binding domain-containing protein [Pilibacter termitis]|uniref:LytTr DNA-binding domain-containing protein n=1 Tax=Pilibacter termitis TaxID=263852 RepID=A0A1T4KFS1_9ENTE|nr:LytTR family transcriptional regulator DNA-binding domain-containing protein [Pilibacter termitis]SJZ41215.1 LytTr DNA-binding domain-containing protein [Pilibacter termitis]